MKGLRKEFYRKITTGLLTVCMAAMLTACGSSSKDAAMQTMSSAFAPETVVNGAGSFEYGYYEETVEDGAMLESSELKSTAENSGSTAIATDRKLIKTVDMNVETQKYDELLPTIQNQVTELGGYIESMNTYNGSVYYDYRPTRNADMTIRIPKDKLDGFLSTVSDISNVVRRSDNVEDVTLAYVDLASHRDALRTEQSRLLELLEKAETVEDIITIEQRLSDVRYQLESMESQLRTYDNQVDYSTVYLSIEEVEIFTPVEEETVWERISGGFMESLDNVGEGCVEFGIWFVVNIPYMVVWAIVIAIIVLIVMFAVKRSARPSKKSVNKNIANQMQDGKTMSADAPKEQSDKF